MKGIFRRTPSPALVISCIALAVALSGVGYAAVALPRNSVGTAQLKANAVNSAKVKSGSLLSSDFKAGQLPTGTPGAAGPKGDTGAIGPTGPQGPGGSEEWHEIGTNISPGCADDDRFCNSDLGSCSWHNLDTTFSSAGYYRDPSGVVHLKGVVSRAGGTCGLDPSESLIFLLPAGFRPAKASIFATVSNDVHATVYVNDYLTPGAVKHHAGGDSATWLALDGISFRCKPSGSDGCP